MFIIWMKRFVTVERKYKSLKIKDYRVVDEEAYGSYKCQLMLDTWDVFEFQS